MDHVKFSRWQAETSAEVAFGSLLGGPIDVVEYGRGQLAALTYLTAGTAQEVHILRLRISFDRAGIPHKLRYALNVLNLMREVQELHNGYWFPTPLRVVPIEGQAIVVAPLSTYELRRHLPSTKRAGYARVCLESDGRNMPKQELDKWLGLDAQDAATWVEAILKKSREDMGPSIPSGNVQFFNVEVSRSAVGSVSKCVWKNDPRSALSCNGVALCRESVTREQYRYFVGRITGARLVAEGPVVRDTIRVQFGFAALCGKPLTVALAKSEDAYIFHIPIGLPRAERRLILALGVRDMSFPGRVYRVSNDFMHLIEGTLRRLGCEVRTYRV